MKDLECTRGRGKQEGKWLVDAVPGKPNRTVLEGSLTIRRQESHGRSGKYHLKLTNGGPQMVVKDEANGILDAIIKRRRTVRSFTPEMPKRQAIEEIINAGLWAPYAALAVAGEQVFRRFFVIQNGSPILSKVSELIQQQARASLEEMNRTFNEKPFLREKSVDFMNRLSSMVEKGFPDLLSAPCLIIIAERKGIPPAEKQSLAHAIQNMWLKATALGLGMRLISVIESLTENTNFCNLVGLSNGEFAFSGCIVGFSAQEPNVGKRPGCDEVTKWM